LKPSRHIKNSFLGKQSNEEKGVEDSSLSKQTQQEISTSQLPQESIQNQSRNDDNIEQGLY